MKRYGNLFKKIASRNTIIIAHKMASIGKKNRAEVKFVDENMDKCVDYIYNILNGGEYKLSEDDYNIMEIEEYGKKRIIKKLNYFPHRIIQWAILLHTEDIFQKMFIETTYASIPERGIHKCLHKILRDISKSKLDLKYCLKIDVKSFYGSIDNNILYAKLCKKFKDQELLALFKTIIFSNGDIGQPIGSLLSQYFGNFYLCSVDYELKKSCKYYYRYCDDIIILGDNKDDLHKYFDILYKSLNDISLTIKKNYKLFNYEKQPIDFLGYKIYSDGKVILRRSIYEKYLKLINRLNNKDILTYSDTCSLNSYLGWIIHSNYFMIFNKTLIKINNKDAIDYNGGDKKDMSKQISEMQLKYILDLSKKDKINKFILKEMLSMGLVDITQLSITETQKLINKIRLLND